MDEKDELREGDSIRSYKFIYWKPFIIVDCIPIFVKGVIPFDVDVDVS